jgi:hypothetical protein
MLKQGTMLRNAAFAAIVAALFSLPTASAALAQHRDVNDTSIGRQCEVVDAISQRCLNFRSDSTWPAGLADYHGSNGG